MMFDLPEKLYRWGHDSNARGRDLLFVPPINSMDLETLIRGVGAELASIAEAKAAVGRPNRSMTPCARVGCGAEATRFVAFDVKVWLCAECFNAVQRGQFAITTTASIKLRCRYCNSELEKMPATEVPYCPSCAPRSSEAVPVPVAPPAPALPINHRPVVERIEEPEKQVKKPHAESTRGDSIQEGRRIAALAGNPTTEEIVLVYGKAALQKSWTKRVLIVPAERFQEVLGEKRATKLLDERSSANGR